MVLFFLEWVDSDIAKTKKKRSKLLLTVHVHINCCFNGSCEVSIDGLTSQPGSEEAPVDIVKRDLVPHCSVTQDMVRLVN